MELENYRDLSSSGAGLGAGFQFEFRCSHCSNKWKSPFKPYRMGQLTAFLQRFAFLLGGGASTAARATGGYVDYGSRKAWEEALGEARRHADTLYSICEQCQKAYCADCLKGSICLPCIEEASEKSELDHKLAAAAAEVAASDSQRCSNCGCHVNGRFCAECGFDMASTHKSCPSCGVMSSRQARFCTDCGHNF